ncbi:hypothetical protein HanIR_Chr12g0573411 [Helianthus annuus]|nr:hypothetical protein HanIR_Chr12g0573411 [Helianthus annuus]
MKKGYIYHLSKTQNVRSFNTIMKTGNKTKIVENRNLNKHLQITNTIIRAYSFEAALALNRIKPPYESYEKCLLGTNILESTDLLFSHGRHNCHNKVLPFSKTILNLHIIRTSSNAKVTTL